MIDESPDIGSNAPVTASGAKFLDTTGSEDPGLDDTTTAHHSTLEVPALSMEEQMEYMQLMDAENDEEDQSVSQCQCKLFIGGLSWETDEQALTTHFEQFGEVTDVMVVYNRTAGVSRGFGFVTFKDREVAQHVISVQHRINDKSVEAKLAVQKGEQVRESFDEKMARQIFVGGLPPNTTSDQLKEWAQALFGKEKVTNAIAVLDLETKTTRGFGFVNFSSPEMVEVAVQPGLVYDMAGKRVEVKRAQAQLHHQRSYFRGVPNQKGKGARHDTRYRRDPQPRQGGGKGARRKGSKGSKGEHGRKGGGRGRHQQSWGAPPPGMQYMQMPDGVPTFYAPVDSTSVLLLHQMYQQQQHAAPPPPPPPPPPHVAGAQQSLQMPPPPYAPPTAFNGSAAPPLAQVPLPQYGDPPLNPSQGAMVYGSLNGFNGSATDGNALLHSDVSFGGTMRYD